jgi:hypothetical protein
MSTVLVIAIGSRIVAVAVAVAVTCAIVVPAIRNIPISKGAILLKVFIIKEF